MTHSVLSIDLNLAYVQEGRIQLDLLDARLAHAHRQRCRAAKGMLLPVDGPFQVEVLGRDLLVVGERRNVDVRRRRRVGEERADGHFACSPYGLEWEATGFARLD